MFISPPYTVLHRITPHVREAQVTDGNSAIGLKRFPKKQLCCHFCAVCDSSASRSYRAGLACLGPASAAQIALFRSDFSLNQRFTPFPPISSSESTWRLDGTGGVWCFCLAGAETSGHIGPFWFDIPGLMSQWNPCESLINPKVKELEDALRCGWADGWFMVLVASTPCEIQTVWQDERSFKAHCSSTFTTEKGMQTDFTLFHTVPTSCFRL